MKVLKRIQESKKRSSQIILVAVALCCTLAACAEALTLASWPADYSTTQGSNGWWYRRAEGGQYWHVPSDYVLSLASDDGWAFGPDLIWNGGGVTSVGQWTNLRWRSSVNSYIRVSGDLTKLGMGGDGITVYIQINGITKWSTRIEPEDANGYAFDILIPVVVNDNVDFLVDPGATNDYDNFGLNVTIQKAVGPNTVASWPADYSTTQGSNDWWYRRAEGGQYWHVPSDYVLDLASDGGWAFGPDLIWNGGGVTTIGQWTNLRWVSSVNSDIRVSGDLTKLGMGGDGITGYLQINGITKWSAQIGPEDANGYAFDIPVPVAVNDNVDFLVNPGATNYYDNFGLNVQIDQINQHKQDDIPYGSGITIDGNLADWAGADWIPLNEDYDGDATDVAEAYYAAKWGDGGNKLQLAIKVRDTDHVFTDSYLGYDARDAVEIYLHTTGTGASSYPALEEAQDYQIGVKNSNNSEIWTAMGNNTHAPGEVPASANFQAAGSVSGEWIFYEAAITPYKYFGGFQDPIKPNIISTLRVGDVIGLDVIVAARDRYDYTGMKSTNLMYGKSWDFTQFATHRLIGVPTSISDTKMASSGVISSTGVVTAVFNDCFYVEDVNRTSGIRVQTSADVPRLGTLVTIYGNVATLASGERFIDAVNYGENGPGAEIKPLGITNKSLGGGDFGVLPNGQLGVSDGAGLNNIGLLVKTWGVVSRNEGATFLTDGSGVALKLVGLPVSVSGFITVTGISSCERLGTNIVRILRVTDWTQE